jgi:ketosteroid isomerase-like protein
MGTQQEMLDNMQAAYEVDMEIEVSGDIAYAMGTYIIDMVPRGDAPSTTMDGKFLTIFRRQDDGSWKI